MLTRVLNQFFEIRNQFPTSKNILTISDSFAVDLIKVSSVDSEKVSVGFNEAVLTQKGLEGNLGHLVYISEFIPKGDYRWVEVDSPELAQKIVKDLVELVFGQPADLLQFDVKVDDEPVALDVIVAPARKFNVLEVLKKLNPRVCIGAGVAAVLVILLCILLGGGNKTFKDKHAPFAAINDPILQLVSNCYSNFSSEFSWSLEGVFDDCMVEMEYDSKKDLVTSIVVVDNENGKTVYERHLRQVVDGEYEADAKFWGMSDSPIVELTGVFSRYTSSVKRKDVDFNNCLEGHELTYITGELKFLGGSGVFKSIKYEDGIEIKDYWSNGQEKLVRKYQYDDKWKIKEAYNYNEDGTAGNPFEIYTLLKGRWIGFSCNLVQTISREPVYLILRPSKDDWHKGRAFLCCSRSSCKNDYRFMQKGQYSIDEDGYIKLHSMKDSGGRKCDVKRLKIGGTSSRLTLSGKFDNNSSHFVSDLNVNSRSWFKKSIQSKYKVY